MYEPGDNASHLLVAERAECPTCEGRGREYLGPRALIGRDGNLHHSDITLTCRECDGTRIAEPIYCAECGDVRVKREGERCAACVAVQS